MKIVLASCVALTLVVGGCGKPSAPILVLDGWWNVDYAKDVCRSAKKWFDDNKSLVNQVGCNSVTSCPEMTPRYEACMTDDTGGVGDYETLLVSELAASPECKGVQIYQMHDPSHSSKEVSDAMSDDRHWALTVDFIPGSKAQSWSLVQKLKVAKGEGNLQEAARKICTILNAKGAVLAN